MSLRERLRGTMWFLHWLGFITGVWTLGFLSVAALYGVFSFGLEALPGSFESLLGGVFGFFLYTGIGWGVRRLVWGECHFLPYK